MKEKTKDRLRFLVANTNAAGRGRLDSDEWQDKDEAEYLERLEEIIRDDDE